MPVPPPRLFPALNLDQPASLRSGEVAVWLVDQRDFAGVNVASLLDSFLSSEERDDVARYRKDELQRQATLSHFLKRWCLSRHTGVPLHQWRFARQPQGKPFVAEPLRSALAFNVSHTKHWLVCGVALGGALGIDIESLQRKRSSTRLAERYFSPEEVEYLKRLPSREQDAHFIRLWTLKESYIKAVGGGLSIPLDSFSFQFDPNFPTTLRVEQVDQSQQWMFAEFHRANDFRLSVGLEHAQPNTCNVLLHQLKRESAIEAHKSAVAHRENRWQAVLSDSL